ncbi:N-acetylmuramoyl-L-alanine amidase family protein [Paenibacillus naphthalenovorans]|uniref:N-acetylmuramoyl-L-alanine amidase family protein n=1 Tax=Paenibacillus naphthalenovorans TaxID=162209 RepID=UPI003D2D38BA
MKIMIDAGHGGKDPGAVGNGLREKDLTLKLALRIGELLTARGADVRYTRTNDVFLELLERARAANTAGVDYFVSIHINAGGGSGFESFTYPGSSGVTAAYRNVIHHHVAAAFDKFGLPDRGQKQANLAVLRETHMPATLLEYGFIDHFKDSALLKEDGFLEQLAQSTAAGVAEAFLLPEPTIPQKGREYMMKAEDANKIIRFLSAGWFATDNVEAKAEFKRLANELRKVSGQPIE